MSPSSSTQHQSLPPSPYHSGHSPPLSSGWVGPHVPGEDVEDLLLYLEEVVVLTLQVLHLRSEGGQGQFD